MNYSTLLTAKSSFGVASQARFGALRPLEEKKIFELLPPEARVMELINKYEEVSRTPMGFDPPKQREARESQQKQVEQKLLSAVKNPGFTKAHASALMLELYQKRDELQHQLPEEIFNIIFTKATEPEPRAARKQAEEPLPDSLRKRMGGVPGADRLRVPAGDLEALLAAAAKKGYGQN